MGLQLLLGFSLGGAIGFFAYQARALTRSGAWMATICGGLIFGLGGLPWAVLLLTFFISSSLLSRLFGRRKATLNEKFSKGSRRDAGQVLANGGLGALLAITHALLPGQAWPWAAFLGAMAAVNADTWATELGVLNRTPPRLITTGRPVETGSSGGVSLGGSLAALAGAGLVGLAGAIFMPGLGLLANLGPALLGGLAGSYFDSLLGATLQSMYYCTTCRKETERHPLHTCGTQTTPVRGLRWLDNDWVNIACSAVGACIAVLAWALMN